MDILQAEVLELERYGRNCTADIISRKPDWAQGGISRDDSAFLSGLVNRIKPKRVVEIGVASGWSGANLLTTLQAVGAADAFQVHGIDLSRELYTDKSLLTGSVIPELLPDLADRYMLKTGVYGFQGTPKVGEVDFAFIDAHHMHPWATLDLIAVLPFLPADAWVALHDINLCGVPRHQHRNRAPYYLFYLWKGERLHSTVDSPMIGAIRLNRPRSELFADICQILATPWEVKLPAELLAQFQEFVRQSFGTEVAEQIDLAMAAGMGIRKG